MLLPLLTYLPAIQGGFIWDDDEHVYANPVLMSEQGLWDIWFKENALPQYYPLVHTTFWLEYRFWQRNPTGYHLINVLLHTLSAICLWRLLKKMEIPGAWLAALLFAVHPVHVESVAWVTERKNVLSGLFYLLAASVYWRRFVAVAPPEVAAARHESTTAPPSGRWMGYALFLVLFLAALLSKSVTSTLPAALLLMIWLRQGRIPRRHVLLLAPAFVIGVAMGLHTAQIERDFVGATGSRFDWSFAERCIIAGKAVWFYAAKLLWPDPLTFFYPKWEINAASAVQWLYPLSAIGLVLLLGSLRHRIGRGPLVAVLYFGGTLLPALGFVNYYPMRFSFVADHFQYLASLGLLVLFAALAASWIERIHSRVQTPQSRPLAAYAAQAALSMMVVGLCVLSARHAHVLADEERLYRDTLAKNPASDVAHNQLGLLLRRRGELQEALRHFRQVVEMDSQPEAIDRANILATEGLLLLEQDQPLAAIAKVQAAIDLWPNAGRFYFFLAEAQRANGDFEAALQSATQALERGDRLPMNYLLHARLAAETGDYSLAVGSYRRALAMGANPEAAAELAWILAAHWEPQMRHPEEAEGLAYFALQSRVGIAQALETLAAVQAQRGQTKAATTFAQQALQQAEKSGDARHVREIRQRLEAYQRDGAYQIAKP